jgi:hypothetical protein
MEQPRQVPPVDRQYMSPVIGRKSKSSAHPQVRRKSKSGDKKEHTKRQSVEREDTSAGDNFVLELTVFHVPPYRRRWL